MSALPNAAPNPVLSAAQPAPMPAYVPEIDGLRAFAMTAVVLQHCALAPFGWIGVWLFYVISGFAITTSLMGAERKNERKPLMIRNFLIRRALRIWPIYFLFILFITSLVIAGGGKDLSEAAWLAGFMYNFHVIAHGVSWGWVGHLWTISVEEHFYLVFPFIFALLGGDNRQKALWGLVAFAPVLRAILTPVVAGWDFTDEQKAVAIYMFSPAHFDGFALGALIALNRSKIWGRLDWARRALAAAFVLVLAYVAYGLWLNWQAGHRGIDLARDIVSGVLWGDGRQVLVYLAVTWMAAAIVFAVAAGSPTLKRLLSLPGLQAIGRISFGAYIFHIFIVTSVGAALPATPGGHWDPARQLLQFAIVYPLTLMIAALSFRFIERPILKLRERFP